MLNFGLIKDMKNINRNEVNKNAKKEFKIAFISDLGGYTRFMNDLIQSKYDFMNLKMDREMPLTAEAASKVEFIDIKELDGFVPEVKPVTIFITDEQHGKSYRTTNSPKNYISMIRMESMRLSKR